MNDEILPKEDTRTDEELRRAVADAIDALTHAQEYEAFAPISKVVSDKIQAALDCLEGLSTYAGHGPKTSGEFTIEEVLELNTLELGPREALLEILQGEGGTE